MRIAYVNLVDSATLTESDEDLVYPVENVQNQRLAKAWRTTVLTGITVVADLGGTAAVTMAAIIGHNLTSAATLTISGNTASSFVSPAFTTSMTAVDGLILKYFDQQDLRYWQWSIDDDANSDGYIEIGRLWAGVYWQVDPSSTLDFTVTKKRSDTVVHGRGRQKYATQGVGWRAFELSFEYISGTALTSVQTFYDTVGMHSSFVFSNLNTSLDYDIVLPCYCSLSDDIGFRHRRFMSFDYKISFEEDR